MARGVRRALTEHGSGGGVGGDEGSSSAGGGLAKRYVLDFVDVFQEWLDLKPGGLRGFLD